MNKCILNSNSRTKKLNCEKRRNILLKKEINEVHTSFDTIKPDKLLIYEKYLKFQKVTASPFLQGIFCCNLQGKLYQNYSFFEKLAFHWFPFYENPEYFFHWSLSCPFKICPKNWSCNLLNQFTNKQSKRIVDNHINAKLAIIFHFSPRNSTYIVHIYIFNYVYDTTTHKGHK